MILREEKYELDGKEILLRSANEINKESSKSGG